MSKQLNELTGKGALLAMGQTAVANFLSTNSQADLAAKVGYFKKGQPNAGAAYNALKDLGWLPESKRTFTKAVANFDKATQLANKSAQPVIKPQPAVKPAGLPGRVEDYFFDSLGWDEDLAIQQHHVELAVLSDTPAWNRLVRRFGPEEKEMLHGFLGAGCTLADRAEIARNEKRNRPFIVSAETVAKFASIDTGLMQREARFESSRYDADLTSFYLVD